ncbi:hypothetical protein Gpo141_00014167 [Globisporangium polare]
MRVPALSSADEEQLKATSTRVAQELLPTLADRIGLEPNAFQSALLPLSAIPVLSLGLRPNGRRDREVSGEQLPAALGAFAQLATYSRRLGAFPKRVKAHLWGEIGRHAEPDGVNMDMLVQTNSPSFMVNVGSTQQPGELDGAVSAILFAFLTAPVQIPACAFLDRLARSPSRASKKKIALGLSFTHCNLQSLLERVFSHPDRQFDIDVLDLSDNAIGPVELAIVVDIVQKSSSVYKIKELRLNDVLSRSNGSPHTNTPAAFLQIVKTVVNADRMPLANSQPFNQAQPSTLTSVSWSGNSLCPKYFVVLGSALRYGCPVENLLSSYE